MIRILFSFFCLALSIIPGIASGQATALKCEHLPSPLGIDTDSPRLSWQLADSRPGARQSAFEVLVVTDTTASVAKLVWKSGKINSANILHKYRGSALQPYTRYFWKVETWDKEGKKYKSPAWAYFETGLMRRNNWNGAWISDNNSIQFKPVPVFRKSFSVTGNVKSARAYIAVAGLYELFINGKKIGRQELDPMYTRFDRRNLYVTHDITSYILPGENIIGVVLGNGWYNHQSTAVWNFDKAPWRARPAFCMDLRISYTDGSSSLVSSGKDWKTAPGAIIFNSIYTAEHYDSRLEMPDWMTADYNDSSWTAVTLRGAPSPLIVAQNLYPIEITDTIKAIGIQRFNDSNYVFDIGRNIAGISQVQLQGHAGTVVRVKHGERLDSAGHVDQSNIDVHYRPTDDKDPFQTDIYVLKGGGIETFRPHFNYKGFQYVEISSSTPVILQKQDLQAFFMHSNVPVAGQISSSNPTLNKIWAATNNAYLSNLFGYPTDCPQREKNGWTGDAHIASETGLYNFDGITVYEKWLADHRDEQQPNGVLPSIIPTGGWGYEWGNGPDWTSTIAIIPWNIYLFYGDSKLLADSYSSIKMYVDHISSISKDGLTTWGLGDWVPVKSVTPVEFTSTAYYYTDVLILAKAAKLLGKEADAKTYFALAEKIKTAFNKKYLNLATGIYGTGLQTELSVPLQWGLVPDSLKSSIAKKLAERVRADNDHLDVGLLGTKAILNALSENGYANVAYQLASQETFPSWGWWIKNGATTLYENWPIDAKSDISLNHIMFGEIGAWLYKGLGGIFPDEHAPGFKHTILKPNFVDGLDHFEASHQTPYGQLRSAWHRKDAGIIYSATVPPNSSATLYLPDGSLRQLAAGNHVITVN